MEALKLIVGKTAAQRIKEHGLGPEHVRMMVGASGGPKWLILAELDRYLCHNFIPRMNHHVDFIGSSIGAWRMAVYASVDPASMVERFIETYFAFRKSESPSRQDITRKSYEILDEVFTPESVEALINSENRNLNIVAVRGKGIAGSKNPFVETIGMARAAFANKQARANIGKYFERVIFHSGPDVALPDVWNDFGYSAARLQRNTLPDALMASGSIPFVSEPIMDIAGAGPGVYRDGGVTDYHFDRPWTYDSGIVLYPHFYDFLVPGWFDKKRPDRRVKGAALDQVLMVCPNPEFVATLPKGRITERKDFTSMTDEERIPYWKSVVGEGKRLADEFSEMLDDHTKLVESLQPAPE